MPKSKRRELERKGENKLKGLEKKLIEESLEGVDEELEEMEEEEII